MLVEARERFVLVVVDVKDGDESGDGDKVIDLLRHVQKDQASTLALYQVLASGQLSDTRRVHEAAMGEVQDDLSPAAKDVSF